MPCPFLTRMSPNFLRNYGSSLLMSYKQHCPVMSRLSSGDTPQSIMPDQHHQVSNDPTGNKCPFLSEKPEAVKEASLAVEQDVISLNENTINQPDNANTFQYESFFNDQIIRKKKDHSYRYKKFTHFFFKFFSNNNFSIVDAF